MHLLSGTLIAILSGIIGVFVIARNMTFLTHILSETGFAGAHLDCLWDGILFGEWFYLLY